MDDREIRFECLKIAAIGASTPSAIMHIAREIYGWIAAGTSDTGTDHFEREKAEQLLMRKAARNHFDQYRTGLTDFDANSSQQQVQPRQNP